MYYLITFKSGNQIVCSKHGEEYHPEFKVKIINKRTYGKEKFPSKKDICQTHIKSIEKVKDLDSLKVRLL